VEEQPAQSPLVETARNHRPLLLWLAGLTVFGTALWSSLIHILLDFTGI
jgi:hypothetical protein